MYRSRVIPCLLLKGKGLYKTIQFKKPRYLGDPINTLMLFNNKEVDELIILDIEASLENKAPDMNYLKLLASECFMPLCYGGGVTTIQQVESLFKVGIEKVSFNTALFYQPELIKEAVKNFGSQSIIASIDVKKGLFGKYSALVKSGTIDVKKDLSEYVKHISDLDVGELVITSIDNDGMMKGYDHNLIKKVSSLVDFPVIANGGAGLLKHCVDAIETGASAASAGSLFVYYGPLKAVLVNYPTQDELKQAFKQVMQ